MRILFLKNFYKKYKLHLIVWATFIIYEVFITGLIIGSFSTFENYFLHYLLNISLLYFHAYLLKILIDRKYNFIYIVIAILIELLAYCLSAIGIALIIYNFFDSTYTLNFNMSYITRTLWRCLYFMAFGTGYFYIQRSFKESRRAEELERQNLTNKIEKQTLENELIRSQNNFLRSQINPHFLFNTLNFIYNDARKKAPLAADAIMNLAEMMRYALKRNEDNDLVPISEEIEQIEYLINLHKLRTAGAINLTLNIEDDLFGIKFPPLILLTLVENIFKHGNINHSSQNAEINISVANQKLIISTVNMINTLKAKESTNIGIENIKKRLENVYKNEFVFNYHSDQTNRYFTQITVPTTVII